MDGWETPSETDQERWAEDAEAAYQEAQRRIAKAKAEGRHDLDFGQYKWALPALSALPPEISELTNVSVLDLRDTQISDVSALSGLPALKILNLSNTTVSDVSALSGLPALKHLYLSGTAVSDVSALSGLRSLLELYLGGTAVSDVSALSGLPALKSLFLSSTQVSDLSVLSGLPALKFLDLNGTAVSDVSALSGLPALESLFLKGTSVSDVSALSGLTALKYLNLNSTAVSDLSPLSELSSLIDGAKKFDFYGLYYDNTPVAAQPVFSELVKLDTSERTIQTLQYLNGEHPVYGGPPPPVGGSGKKVTKRDLLNNPPAKIVLRRNLVDIDPIDPADTPEDEDDREFSGLPRRQQSIAETLIASLGHNQPTAKKALENYRNELDRPQQEIILELLKEAYQIAKAGIEQAKRENALDDDAMEAWEKFESNHAIYLAHYPFDAHRENQYRNAPVSEDADPSKVADAFKNFLEVLKEEEVASIIGQQLKLWAESSADFSQIILEESRRPDPGDISDEDLPLRRLMKRQIAQGWVMMEEFSEWKQTEEGRVIADKCPILGWDRCSACFFSFVYALTRPPGGSRPSHTRCGS